MDTDIFGHIRHDDVRSVQSSGESDPDGGGYRFVFYGGGRRRQGGGDQKPPPPPPKAPGPPVDIHLSEKARKAMAYMARNPSARAAGAEPPAGADGAEPPAGADGAASAPGGEGQAAPAEALPRRINITL